VSGLDLVVAEGETLVLVGPSGCGKSTTLRMVAGLETPDSGVIEIGGRDVSREAPQDRDIAMVFQGFALYPHLRVSEILEFPLKMRRVPRPDRKRRVQSTADLLGISHLLGRRPGELSGGEQQRVAMGRAIVREPRAFLFDEPLSNLDPALRAELRVELKKLLRRLGATALYVTHDQTEAMTLGDRIAVLREGRLEQVACPETIYEAPETAFVAGFFGTPPMNLLSVDHVSGEGRLGEAALKVPPGAPAELWLGLRPEDVCVAGPDCSPNGLLLEGVVTAVEPQGAETHLELRVAGSPLKTKVRGFRAPQLEAKVRLSVDLSRARWFDRKSGRCL
jgi:multiple sugar transport system ATP-binding protein